MELPATLAAQRMDALINQSSVFEITVSQAFQLRMNLDAPVKGNGEGINVKFIFLLVAAKLVKFIMRRVVGHDGRGHCCHTPWLTDNLAAQNVPLCPSPVCLKKQSIRVTEHIY